MSMQCGGFTVPWRVGPAGDVGYDKDLMPDVQFGGVPGEEISVAGSDPNTFEPALMADELALRNQGGILAGYY